MLGDFITRILVLALGYAYPAYECFKTVEKNRVGIEELRFWCQYWVIVALVTVFERIGDIFVSWLPMYGEMKLVLFIYLWYPKTKGTGYVYGSILKPYLAKHERDIDQNLQEFRARAWDLIIFYAQNGAQLGQATVFQILDYMSSHVGKLRQPSLQKVEGKGISQAPPSPTASGMFKRHKQPSDKRRPPIPPPSPTHNRSVAHPTKPDSVQIHLHEQTKFISSEDTLVVHQDSESSSTENPHQQQNSLNLARLKLRRTRSIH